MRRVVVTGMGIWSCIGQDLQTVTESLKQGRSGIIFDPKRIEYGLLSGLVGNVPRPDLKPLLPRKFRATMSEDSEYAYMAARQAFEQAKMSEDYLRQNEVGIIFGNDGNTHQRDIERQMNIEHDALMLGPHHLFKALTSSVDINLTTIFHLRGGCFGISAACASSAHAIGIAYSLIKEGRKVAFLVGGSMEMTPDVMAAMDALGATSLKNTSPTKASCPFDENHDGIVASGGAAALVLEEYDHAVTRGATIFAEVCGYGFSSNGIDEISAPSADAVYIAMKRALDDAGLLPSDIDYVNAHATSTVAGDIEEAKALTRLFVPKINNRESLIDNRPFISSTKSMTGHENWMAGASEAVYSILMMQNDFIAPNINLCHAIVEASNLNIPTKAISAPVKMVLSNSSGLGGTNATIIFKKIQ